MISAAWHLRPSGPSELERSGALESPPSLAFRTPLCGCEKGGACMRYIFRVAVTIWLASVPVSVSNAQPGPAASSAAEDARLTAFLDAELAEDLKLRPQLATRLGI